MLGVPSWYNAVEDVGVRTRLVAPEAQSVPKNMPLPEHRWIEKNDEMAGAGYPLSRAGPPVYSGITYLPPLINQGVELAGAVQWPQGEFVLDISEFDPPFVEYAEGHTYHWTSVINHLQRAAAANAGVVDINSREAEEPVGRMPPRPELWTEFAMLAKMAVAADLDELFMKRAAQLNAREFRMQSRRFNEYDDNRMRSEDDWDAESGRMETPRSDSSSSPQSTPSPLARRDSFSTQESDMYRSRSSRRASQVAGDELRRTLDQIDQIRRDGFETPKPPPPPRTPYVPPDEIDAESDDEEEEDTTFEDILRAQREDAEEAARAETPPRGSPSTGPTTERRYNLITKNNGAWYNLDYPTYIKLFEQYGDPSEGPERPSEGYYDSVYDRYEKKTPPTKPRVPTPPTKTMRKMTIVDDPLSPPKMKAGDSDLVLTFSEWRKLGVTVLAPGLASSTAYPENTLRFEQTGGKIHVWLE